MTVKDVTDMMRDNASMIKKWENGHTYTPDSVANMLCAYAEDIDVAFEEDAKEIEVNAGVLPDVVINGKGAVKVGKTKEDQLKYADAYRDQINDMVHIMDILKCRIDSMKYLAGASDDGSYVLDQMKDAFVHLSKALIGMHLKQKKHKEAADAQGDADANGSISQAN